MFDRNEELIIVDDGVYGILILRNNNFQSLTLEASIKLNAFTGKSRLIYYTEDDEEEDRVFIITPDTDNISYLNIIDITHVDEAQVIS